MEKKNEILIFAVVLLGILVLILGGYIVYDKLVLGSDKTTETNKNKEEDTNNTKLLTNDEAIVEGKRLYDKATEIYETWVVYPYCGSVRSDIKEQDIEKLGDSGYGNGNYYKSNFTSFEDLKNYLKQWLAEDIVNEKVVKSYNLNSETYYEYVEDLSLLSNKDMHYSYVDYVLKDDKLYCRLDAGKGWMTLYQDKYDIEVVSIEENKITYTITSTYGKQGTNCYLDTASVEICGAEDLEYKDTTFTIEKNESGNFVVSEYTLHD